MAGGRCRRRANDWVARGLGEWGVQHGLFKRRTSTSDGNPQPGDWAIYGPPAGHVSVVTAVYANGDITTVDGNVAPTRTAFAGGAATSRGPSIIDLFYRASDRSVWHKVWNGSQWQHADLGGATLADPAAVATGSGRLDVFVLGMDYRLYVNTWRSGST